LSQKSSIISGSFARNDLQLKASYGSASLCVPFHKHCLPTFKPQGSLPSSLYQHQSELWTFDVYCFHINYGHLHPHIGGFIVDDAQCGVVWHSVAQCDAVWSSAIHLNYGHLHHSGVIVDDAQFSAVQCGAVCCSVV